MKLITLGSKTSTGGKVISASSKMVINGKQVALSGKDQATCKCGAKNCKGVGFIVNKGEKNINVDGVEIAKAFDPVNTGCGKCFLLEPDDHEVYLGTSNFNGENIFIGNNGAGVSVGNNIIINGGNAIKNQARTTKKIQTQEQTNFNFIDGIYKMSQPDNPINKFTKQDLKIISKETLFQGFFRIVKYRFKHKLFQGGWSEVIERELFERGHAAALLPYDPQRDQVVIIEQIRVGALEQHQPWQLEIVAGMIDRNESAIEVVCREAVEEAGVAIGRTEAITSYYPSAGGCSEKLDVYVGEVDSSQAMGIHGLDYEGEDIKVHVMSRQQAYQLVKDGTIENGASIIALQWLELNYQNLQSKWSSINE